MSFLFLDPLKPTICDPVNKQRVSRYAKYFSTKKSEAKIKIEMDTTKLNDSKSSVSQSQNSESEQLVREDYYQNVSNQSVNEKIEETKNSNITNQHLDEFIFKFRSDNKQSFGKQIDEYCSVSSSSNSEIELFNAKSCLSRKGSKHHEKVIFYSSNLYLIICIET